MSADDLAAVGAVAQAVHPAYPEAPDVFADRLILCPEACLVLDGARGMAGYAIGHPWGQAPPPALNTRLERLPPASSALHIHDLALLPDTRAGGHGAAGVALLVAEARRRGLEQMTLVAVGASLRFWRNQGFKAVEGGPGLASYGAAAVWMVRELRDRRVDAG